MKKILMIFGRICLSLIFITAVANHILNWDAMEQALITALHDWMAYPGLPQQLQSFFSLLLSNAPMAFTIATTLAGIGGILVLLGVQVRFGCLCLMLFLIPTTLFMHAFWMVPEAQAAMRDLQMTMFLKNLSILGGILILAASPSSGEAV